MPLAGILDGQPILNRGAQDARRLALDGHMNSSVRGQPLPPRVDEPTETRAEKLKRVREQVREGYYANRDVLRDVADALIMNPAPFEALNEKEEE